MASVIGDAREGEDLWPYLRSWQGYSGFAKLPPCCAILNGGCGVGFGRCKVQWVHWKHGSRRYAELRKRGVWAEWAAKVASSAHGPWRLAHTRAVKIALPDAFFDSLGLPRLVAPVPLNLPNRRMRPRMSGGVAGARG